MFCLLPQFKSLNTVLCMTSPEKQNEILLQSMPSEACLTSEQAASINHRHSLAHAMPNLS